MPHVHASRLAPRPPERKRPRRVKKLARRRRIALALARAGVPIRSARVARLIPPLAA